MWHTSSSCSNSTRPASCCLLLLLLVLAALSAHAAGAGSPKKHKKWRPEEFPNPQKDTKLCGRRSGVASSICDPEAVLSPAEQDMVDGLVNEIAAGSAPFKQAPCDDAGLQGFQVAVAVMHRMDTKGQPDKAAAARDFARALHTAWGVGNPACQNGALLLLAVADRQAHISTGAGVKALVSDAQAAAVLENVRAPLKHKRYGDAVLSAVQQLGLLLSGQAPDPGGVDSDDGLGILVFFVASVAAVMGWAAWSNRKRQARFKACANKLSAIKRDQEAIRGRQYAASSCPICLEDFDQPLTAAGAAAAARAAAAERAVAAAAARQREHGAAGSSAAAAAGDAGAPSAPLLGSDGAAAAAGSSSSRSSRSRAGGGRKPLVLRCGHAFCDPCISKWLEHHTNCPICRKDLDAPDDDQAAAAGASTPGGSSSSRRGASAGAGDAAEGGSGAGGDAHLCGPAGQLGPDDLIPRQVWLPELGYRLRRLRALYPEVITEPMLYAWEEDLAADRDLDERVVARLDPARMSQLEEAGRHGASSSAWFGGGDSSGGGGAGTSW